MSDEPVVIESESASGCAPDAFSVSLQEALTSSRSMPGRLLREWFETLVLTLVLFLFIETFVIQGFKVYGQCMEPNLHSDERLLGNKLIYYLHPPQRGDIIVFKYPEDPSQVFIKRVVGLPGETVEIRAGRVYIGGQRLSEPYLIYPHHGDSPRQRVPEECLFVLGDNRDFSNDSRFWGMLPIKNVEAKAWLRYWPLRRIRILR